MHIQILKGLSEVIDDYDLFIFDLWGVMHDGITAYPDAIKCLQTLRARKSSEIILLSNAARLSSSITAHLTSLGIAEDMYDALLTSGDVTASILSDREKQQSHPRGPRYFHIGPERAQPTLDACGGQEVVLEDAELVICTGFFRKEDQVNSYTDLLKSALTLNLPMICANPDIVIHRGGKIIPCPGAIAAHYEELGGAVERFGKPYPAIYNSVFSNLTKIPRPRAVMIGDSLTTDIRGARQAGIDSLWISGGIHAKDLNMQPSGQLEPDKVHEIAEQAGECPRAILPWLRW
ncbi:TIGR01459 family HAD-type hydrolase [uncultured Kiloniella sp.]|uniref:TIGR01459 family HAD-type hydrolase n=1 Tax=uncultured Kiloniella sp. TaxID=1133091 RepID=UPI00262F2D94|nr:TIGR01459 family HAD-type hydrolase [uncultured Kiloniella sp.]